MSDTRNLLERLEHLRAALSEALVELDALGIDPEVITSNTVTTEHVIARIDDADGIAFEMQNMIDGR